MSELIEIKKLQEQVRKLEHLLIDAFSQLKRLNNESVYFEFDGENCENECDGWDGVSKRCECEGHKLCWVLNDDLTDVEIFLL